MAQVTKLETYLVEISPEEITEAAFAAGARNPASVVYERAYAEAGLDPESIVRVEWAGDGNRTGMLVTVVVPSG